MSNPIVDKFNILNEKVNTVKSNLEKLKARKVALEEQKAGIMTKLQAEFGITSFEKLTNEIGTLEKSLTENLTKMETVLAQVNV